MKTYDLIAIGTGSAMNFMESLLQMNPEMRIAVIDKDDPGGICLTKGCIPTKMLAYPAEMVRTIEGARALGIDVAVRKADFKGIMERMASSIHAEVSEIHEALFSSEELDYYQGVAEFTGPYQLKVGGDALRSDMIFLCLGSRPLVPNIAGLDGVAYHTSDTVLGLRKCPSRMAILGGGYIAAEYGHFFSAMGSKVTIIGRNPQFLPGEEPEVSALAKRETGRHMSILTDHEVIRVEGSGGNSLKITARDRRDGKEKRIVSDEVLVAVGRASNAHLIQPEKGGIETDAGGWIKVNDYLETSMRNIWAFGDANGKHLFKHVANYESKVVFYNAILKKRIKTDYHAVPHAVFCYPEIASVGLRQQEAEATYGKDEILIGYRRYQDTAKGEAMGVQGYFVKVIVERGSGKILGAHIIGPHASMLIQEIINLMYTKDQTMMPIMGGMHIHPALTEVVQGAFISLMPPDEYRMLIKQQGFP
jgi:dihydrolipoamide dehydrogenase